MHIRERRCFVLNALLIQQLDIWSIFSERELKFMFAICSLYVIVRPSVCLSVVCRLSVTFVRPTQTIEIFGNVSTPFGTLAIC